VARTTQTEITIRGYHVDMYSHTNNARYIEFLEEARWQHFDNQMRDEVLTKNGLAFTVVGINIRYRKPSFVGDVITIETGIKEFGRKTITVSQNIYKKGVDELIAEAEVVFVFVDKELGKAVSLNEAFFLQPGWRRYTLFLSQIGGRNLFGFAQSLRPIALSKEGNYGARYAALGEYIL